MYVEAFIARKCLIFHKEFYLPCDSIPILGEYCVGLLKYRLKLPDELDKDFLPIPFNPLHLFPQYCNIFLLLNHLLFQLAYLFIKIIDVLLMSNT